MFNEALSRLDQYETALDAGSWKLPIVSDEASWALYSWQPAKSLIRPATPREASDARKKLEALGFFAPSQ